MLRTPRCHCDLDFPGLVRGAPQVGRWASGDCRKEALSSPFMLDWFALLVGLCSMMCAHVSSKLVGPPLSPPRILTNSMTLMGPGRDLDPACALIIIYR